MRAWVLACVRGTMAAIPGGCAVHELIVAVAVEYSVELEAVALHLGCQVQRHLTATVCKFLISTNLYEPLRISTNIYECVNIEAAALHLGRQVQHLTATVYKYLAKCYEWRTHG